MKLAIIVGSCVSTIKQNELKGCKLLLVQDYSIIEKRTVGHPYVAVDTVGAGVGETVCVVKGAPAQKLFSTSKMPIDSAIVAIVDSFSLGDNEVKA
ncbi:MAG: EutN/CcmL family microcompartment protein [Tepidanaerobacteraceae bacterium]